MIFKNWVQACMLSMLLMGTAAFAQYKPSYTVVKKHLQVGG
jgi:hypothetical protein